MACMNVRPLRTTDTGAYRELRAESLLDTPLAFSASPGDDVMQQRLIEPTSGWILFGAFDGERLVGAAGFLRESRRKAAHKAHLWGMYVTPSHRQRGIGGMLLEAVVEHARATRVEWLHLGVSTDAARRLYERAGFVAWGTERDALRHDGLSADEVRMALRL